MAKKLQVFVSSTYVDLIEERQKAVQAILDAGHIPAGMELFKAGKTQMETIKKWIDESDVYCLILGGRYGSVEEESGLSYTQLEYEYALSKEKNVFAIVLSDSRLHQKAAEDPKGKYIEEENKLKYEQFKKKVKERICRFAESTADVATAISQQLNYIMNTQDAELVGWVRGTKDVLLKEDNSGKQIQADASKKLMDADIYKEKMSEADWEKLRKADEKIRISPGEPRGYVERGKLLVSIDISYLQKAIPDFLYAIFLNPEYSWAYYEMIQALSDGNDHTRAMYYAEEACRLFPKEGNAYGCRAFVKCAKKHYSDSIEDCNKAIELLSNRWFYNTRGRCYRGLGKYYEALEDFVRAHRLDQDYPYAVTNAKGIVKKIGISNVIHTAATEKAGGDFEKAKRYLDGALLADPSNEEGLQEIGGWYYDKRNYYEALEYWKKALELNKSCKNYYLCSAAYFGLNDRQNAKKYCKLALDSLDDGYHNLAEEMWEKL